jgi:flagellar assembly protein FliH
LSNVRKFMFDTEFAADGAVLRDPARGEFQRFTPAEIEAARASAYEEGKGDALAKAERASAEALAALAAHARAIITRLDGLAQSLRAQGAEIALAAARKIAGEALDQFGEARALAAAEAAMETLPQGPRLIVRVAKGSEEALRPRLEAAAKERLFEGALVVRGDEGGAPGDVEIDWSEGAIVIERADIEARIEALVAAALASPAHGQSADDDRSTP